MNLDEKLFQYYLELKGPEAGEWNTSPQCIHTELVTRDYFKKSFELIEGIRVCNVGIGTGDWDDFIGYCLKDKGTSTSVDIDEEICELFKYRQYREGHPNPSIVICKSLYNSNLTKEQYNIVTLIGSAINEVGDFNKCLNACFELLKPNGHIMFMANLNNTPKELLGKVNNSMIHIEKQDIYDAFPEYPFYICKIRKSTNGEN